MEAWDHDENEARMRRGELFYAFTPELTTQRTRCHRACVRFNNAGEVSRRKVVELWRDIIDDTSPLGEDDATLEDEPYVESPIRIDYGTHLRLGRGVYINFNCTLLDTCTISIGSRTLIGPNCCLYTAVHPLEAEVRNGTKGPESGSPITIGEDCWLGGNVIILPGITLGDGVVVGAGSVVTKNVPSHRVVVGNPARIVKILK